MLEDLTSNEMFVALRSMRPGLLEYAGERGWLVCIPQSLSLPRGGRDLTMEDIENHVLMPLPSTSPLASSASASSSLTSFLPVTHLGGKLNQKKVVEYETLSHKRVKIIGGKTIHVMQREESSNNVIRVLHTEDFLTAHSSTPKSPSLLAGSSATTILMASSSSGSSTPSHSVVHTTTITILHLDRPIEGGVKTSIGADSFDQIQVKKYLTMLKSYPEHELIFNDIDNFIVDILALAGKVIPTSTITITGSSQPSSPSIYGIRSRTPQPPSPLLNNTLRRVGNIAAAVPSSGFTSNISTPDASPAGSPSAFSTAIVVDAPPKPPGTSSDSVGSKNSVGSSLSSGIHTMSQLFQPKIISLGARNHPFYTMTPSLEIFVQAWIAAGIGTLLSSPSFLEDIGERFHSHRKLYRTQFQYVIESYIMDKLYDVIFSYYCMYYSSEDEELDKNMDTMNLKDLDIRREFQCPQIEASNILASLSTYRTPLQKLLCLQRVVSAANEAVEKNVATLNRDLGSFSLSADDVLDQLITVLIASRSKGLRNLIAQLVYCRKFHCTNIDTTLLGYTLANFEVAAEYILKQSPRRS